MQLEQIPHSCHLCEFQTFHMNLGKWKFQLHIVPFVWQGDDGTVQTSCSTTMANRLNCRVVTQKEFYRSSQRVDRHKYSWEKKAAAKPLATYSNKLVMWSHEIVCFWCVRVPRELIIELCGATFVVLSSQWKDLHPLRPAPTRETRTPFWTHQNALNWDSTPHWTGLKDASKCPRPNPKNVSSLWLLFFFFFFK